MSVRAYSKSLRAGLKTSPVTKPPPTICALCQVYLPEPPAFTSFHRWLVPPWSAYWTSGTPSPLEPPHTSSTMPLLRETIFTAAPPAFSIFHCCAASPWPDCCSMAAADCMEAPRTPRIFLLLRFSSS